MASASASAGSNRSVTLAWTDNSPNENGFYIERALKAKTLTFSRVATVAANVRTITRTEASGQWVYRVQAFNGVGASAYSNNATIRVR